MTSLVLSKEHKHTPAHKQPSSLLSGSRWSGPPSSLEDSSQGDSSLGEGGDKTRKKRVCHVSVARKRELGTGRQHFRTELLVGETLPLVA
jgi:hypothetical protein